MTEKSRTGPQGLIGLACGILVIALFMWTPRTGRGVLIYGALFAFLSQKQFLDKLFKAVYKSRALLVGFNLPFDLSRLGFDVAAARGPFAGGFSLGLWPYVDKGGRQLRSRYRPRVAIKHVDSKRALMGFTARYKPDQTDLIPEGSPDGKAQKGYRFRGHLLDLRTLAFALHWKEEASSEQSARD